MALAKSIMNWIGRGGTGLGTGGGAEGFGAAALFFAGAGTVCTGLAAETGTLFAGFTGAGGDFFAFSGAVLGVAAFGAGDFGLGALGCGAARFGAALFLICAFFSDPADGRFAMQMILTSCA
ncbi:MAG: hypothetical protein GX580_10890 [Candidatus Hydrogenedens sp.]|nr:hypothetical protein [Candidatus Hydrogenedens sp.]